MSTIPAEGPTYSHTQRAPLCALLYLVFGQLLIAAWLTRNEVFLPIMFLVLAAVMLPLAMAFHYLRVTCKADHVQIGFGPLPIFQRKIYYADMQSAAVSRTSMLDGWGIHYSITRAWVWNLWGFDCVRVKTTKGDICIGTDDAASLADALNAQITKQPTIESQGE